MSDKDWTASLEPLRTRSDVRAFISAALDELITSDNVQGSFPAEIAGLPTGSDREVLESYHRVCVFCERRSANSRRMSGRAIGDKVRDMFVMALDRMKQLPPEPVKIAAMHPVARVRRG